MNDKLIENQYMPMVFVRQSGRDVGYDLFSRLMLQRIVYLGGPITSTTADIMIAQLLHLDGSDSSKPIMMYINSPGGEVYAGLAIVDTMQFIRPEVHTTVVGTAASMGAFIAAQGEHGGRFALPNSMIMIHQPLGGAQGQASDIEIHARQILLLKDRLNQMLAERTGQPVEKIARDTERDNFMTSEEAVAYGLIDSVITKMK